MLKNIRLVNGDKLLNEYIKSNTDNYDCLFIDWISTFSNNPNKARNILIQTAILEENIKKDIKIILFDRYQSITKKEVQFLQKYKNVILCEPALITRAGFTYMPFWTKIFSLGDIKVNDQVRPITFLYKGKIISRIKSFENYYVWAKNYFPDSMVVYNSDDLDQIKIDEYTSKGIEKTSKTYNESQYTIAIGSNNDYKVGYLDPFIFKAAESNCVPFIPYEHRFYRGFQNIKQETLHWFINQYENCYIGLLSEFYSTIDKYYPEMKINSVIDQIDNLLS